MSCGDWIQTQVTGAEDPRRTSLSFFTDNQPPEWSSRLCYTWENPFSVLLHLFEPQLNTQGYKISSSFFFIFFNQSHIFRFLFLEIIFLIFTFYIKFISLSEHHFLQHLLPFWWPCPLCQNSGFLLSRGWNRSHKIYPQVAVTKVLWSWVFLVSFLLTMSSVHT